MYRYRSLASQLAVVVDGVAAQQRRHFRTAATGINLLKPVREAVRAILEGGTALVTQPLTELPEMFRKGILDEDRPLGRLDVQLELEMAERFVLHTDDMAKRCLQLARLALTVSPAEPVQKFLARAGRSYVTGLYPESVVMCRAVLENAIRDKFQRHKKALPTPSGRSEMRTRLERAEEFGWLTRRQRTEAWEVHQRGNKAVHEDPHLTTDVFGTIEATLGLLDVLYQDIKRAT